jgi:predicted RNA-binding Zn-ribbon protein involved in translation (DUF1610 family)
MVWLMSIEIRCTSCNRNIVGQERFARFPCPLCGNIEIVRCETCRSLSVTYKCKKCGFEGP